MYKPKDTYCLYCIEFPWVPEGLDRPSLKPGLGFGLPGGSSCSSGKPLQGELLPVAKANKFSNTWGKPGSTEPVTSIVDACRKVTIIASLNFKHEIILRNAWLHSSLDKLVRNRKMKSCAYQQIQRNYSSTIAIVCGVRSWSPCRTTPSQTVEKYWAKAAAVHGVNHLKVTVLTKDSKCMKTTIAFVSILLWTTKGFLTPQRYLR